GYLFDLPSQHWSQILPFIADCMTNCVFNEEHLNSELKAVIQELKMFNDDFVSTLIKSLVSAVFADHPYHNPVIGYKQDLWSLRSDDLKRFYKHHYIPNNATLVIVGDIDTDDTLKQIEKAFGAIVPDPSYTKDLFYHSSDLVSQAVTLYRDVALPSVLLGWVIPGVSKGDGYLLDIVAWVLGTGKGSRFHKKFVDELQLVTSLEIIPYDLFEWGIFFIYFQPKRIEDTDRIIALIQEELLLLTKEHVSVKEIERAVKQAEIGLLSIYEDNQKQAYEIGKSYLSTHNEDGLYNIIKRPVDLLAEQIQEFISSHMRNSLMHKGMILPLIEEDKSYWVTLQELSDEEDNAILSQKVRGTSVKKESAVGLITIKPPKPFVFPRAETVFLDNGLKLLFYSYDQLPKIDMIIDFQAKHTSDPDGKEGIASFVAAMLLEGTRTYMGHEFLAAVESYGMFLDSAAGQINMSFLSVDLPKALEFVNEMLMQATFPLESIEKIRGQMLAELQDFWDSPMQFSVQLAREEIYKHLPQRKSRLGTKEGVESITRDDLIAYYKDFITPQGTRISLVGNLEGYVIKDLFEASLGYWHGPEVPALPVGTIDPLFYHEKNYPLLRDQTTLCFAGVSVDRMNKDYDALLIFDQIFSGGFLGTMSSRLFALREQSGLFYSISGSLIAGASEQKGTITVKTIVSNDRLKEAESAIAGVINTAIDNVSDDEFVSAKRAIVNSLVDNFATNYQIALTFLFMDKYQFPPDYYDIRPRVLDSITKEAMQDAVKRYMDTEHFILIRVGRV
nr:insulinase family protein [Candidatus Dependentiae bacterium]